MSDRVQLAAGTFLTLLFLLAGGPRAQAQHPTAVTSIVNSNQDTTMEVNYNGSLLLTGSPVFDGTENDSIPAEGPGTRLLWYPAKAAFRTGSVGNASGKGDVWDADSVGRFSVALGQDTKANGYAAVAMGDGATASGRNATAMGKGTTAGGTHATAMGLETVASGLYTTAMGKETKASDRAATAMGRFTVASGRLSTAMGTGTKASGRAATAMGNSTVAATDRSLSIGKCNAANTTADGTVFVVGHGYFSSGSCNRSDALVLETNGDLTISGSLTENSDRRLKTGIEPLGSGVLKKLSRLRPVRFEFKNQRTHPSGEQIGLVAQDVRKEFPSLVSKGSSGYLSLAYPKLTAVLVKGLQEQQATIDSLKRRVRSLEEIKNRQARLAQQVAALKAARSSPLPAGWGLSALVALLVGAGSFGLGLLWRRRA